MGDETQKPTAGRSPPERVARRLRYRPAILMPAARGPRVTGGRPRRGRRWLGVVAAACLIGVIVALSQFL